MMNILGLRLKLIPAAICVFGLAAILAAHAQFSQLGPLLELSQPNPVAGCDDGFYLPGTLTLNDANEPFVAVNPANTKNIVATWILGPFQNIIAGVSLDAGKTWQQVPIPLTLCSGGPFIAAGDERVAFAPNGDLYAFAVTGNSLATRSVSVTKSLDGGLHWSQPSAMSGSTYAPNDLTVVTPDPTDSHFVYAIWDGFDSGHRGPAVFTRTTDGGNTWEIPRAIVQTTPQDYVQFSQLLVLPDGTLVDVYELVDVKNSGHGIQQTFSLQVLRSSDRGLTWSGPINAGTMLPLYGGSAGNSLTVDPENGTVVDDPLSQAVAADSQGNIYMVWEDGRFSNFQYNDMALSMSADGGLTWTSPIRVNQTPLNIPPANRQAFLPAVAVAANGTIGVSYYDFRFNDPSPGVPTDYWLVQCHPASTMAPANPANWGNELRLTSGSFNLEACPLRLSGYFLGDYFGLAATANGLVSTFTVPDPNNGISTVVVRRIGP